MSKVLKVIPVTGAAFAGVAMNQLMCASRSPHPLVVKDGRDWMATAKNVGMWHRGVERGAEELDNAWRRADLRQSYVRRQRKASEFVQ